MRCFGPAAATTFARSVDEEVHERGLGLLLLTWKVLGAGCFRVSGSLFFFVHSRISLVLSLL